MELSHRVLSVAPSVTLAISARAKQMKADGIDVVALSAGEPDFDTPSYIKDAANDSLQRGFTKYTPAVGTLEFRKAICEKFKRDQNIEFTPDRIIVSVGAKHSVFNILFALLNPNDEVIIPAPFWLSYPEMVTLVGGKSVIVNTSESDGFKLTPETLKKAITPKSKVLILNSPSNPTGAVYSKEELESLWAVLKDYPDLTILSDEIYEKLIYDGLKHISIAQLNDEAAARTIIVNGHSKAYSMTGWRLGYAACPNIEIAKAITSLQSHSTSNPTSFAQAGGIVALERGDEDAKKMLATFQKRRDWFYENLQALPKIKPVMPQGAFYMFVNISETGKDSVSLSEALLNDAHVAVVPGKAFGADQYVRMSFAASDENLSKAVDRIGQWLKS